jgi:hypothetical protein
MPGHPMTDWLISAGKIPEQIRALKDAMLDIS